MEKIIAELNEDQLVAGLSTVHFGSEICARCRAFLESKKAFEEHLPTFAHLKASAQKCAICRILLLSCQEEMLKHKDSDQLGPISVWVERHTPRNGVPFTYISAQCRKGDGLLTDTSYYFSTQLGNLLDRPIWKVNDTYQITDRLALLKDWLTQCVSTHPRCALSKSDPQTLPIRIIDLGPSDGTEPPRLRVTNGENGLYTTLSYCWGASPPFKTTKATYEALQQSIQLQALPRTFQHAFLITKQLNIRYLWIDALCIIQDDLSDWERESTKMASIFRNSVLTIAAADSLDSQGGCIYPFKPCIKLYDGASTMYARPINSIDSEPSPLDQRGWILQEVVLSCRVVRFEKDQMEWQCTTRIASEDGYIDDVSNDLHLQASRWSAARAYDLYDDWSGLASNYSRRKLSYRKDKIAALAGLISRFHEVTNATPVIGLWKEALHIHLLWYTTRPLDKPPDSGMLPTWSWLYADTTIYFHRDLMWENRLKVIDTSISWSGPPFTSQLLAASVVLCSLLIKVEMRKTTETRIHWWLYDIYRWDPASVTSTEDKCSIGRGSFDFDQHSSESCFWCFLVASGSLYRHVLILRPTEREEGEYIRVGSGEIYPFFHKLGQPEDNDPFYGVQPSTITLV